MKMLYVVDKNTYLSFSRNIGESHYIDLDGTNILVSCELAHGIKDQWESLPQVAPLPHPLSGKNIGSHERFTLLNQVLGAAANDMVYDLAEKARKIHPLMGL